MRAVVLIEPEHMELREVVRPAPGAREALVRVAAVGLCGTDFHIFSGEANYNLDERGSPVPLSDAPQILGHEITGEVVALGDGVTDLAPGDHVAVDQGRNCVSEARSELCEYCATGDSHQCEFYAEHGLTGLAGGLADYVALPAVNLVRIESGLEPAFAAMTEPLACVLHSCATLAGANARYGLTGQGDSQVRTILICGAGPAGNLFTQVLRKVQGFAGRILVSDPDATKRELACAHGAEGIDPGAVGLTDAVRELTGGRRVELMIDACGSGRLFEDMPGVIRKQATVLLYGQGHAGTGLDALTQVQFREPTLITPVGASSGFDADGRPTIYRRALRLLEQGTIDVAPLVTHRFESLDAVPAAFAGAQREPGYIKGIAVLE